MEELKLFLGHYAVWFLINSLLNCEIMFAEKTKIHDTLLIPLIICALPTFIIHWAFFYE